jgi:tetratricopeptide (TPR) repeat protein
VLKHQYFKPEDPPEVLRSQKLVLLGIFVLCVLAYSSVFTFGWIHDDWPQIAENGALEWSNLRGLLTQHQWASSSGLQIGDPRFFRPVLQVWLLLNKSVFGLNPHWFHLTSLFVHLIAATLVWFIARAFLKDVEGAILAVTVFALHPLQVETVSWISDVNDSLAAVFSFAAFLCVVAGIRKGNFYLWSLAGSVLFALAIFTKEAAVGLPAIILTYLLVRSGGGEAPPTSKKQIAWAMLLFGTVVVTWFVIRMKVVGAVVRATADASWATAIWTAPKILLFYLTKVIAPSGLSFHYNPPNADSGASFEFALPVLIIALLCGTAIYAYRQSRNGTLMVACAWLLIPIAPALNVRWLNAADPVHDRYMYTAMLGVALLAGLGLKALHERRPGFNLGWALCILLAVAMAFSSAVQAQYWNNERSLFGRAVEVAPKNPWSHFNYGVALGARKRYAEAAAESVKAYELAPGWRASKNAGYFFQQAGDVAQAERWLTVASKENPSLAEVWFSLGQIELEKQQPASAVQLFHRALELSSNREGYNFALGMALEQKGDRKPALDAYRTELNLYPYQVAAQRAIERLEAGSGGKR